MPSSSFTFSDDKRRRINQNGVFATKTKKAFLVFLVVAAFVLVLSLIRRSPQNTTPADVGVAGFVSSFAASNSIQPPPHPVSCYPKIGLRPLRHRGEMPELLEEHKLKSGIEIGVKQGSYAKLILDGWKSCEKYHLVDLWAKQEHYEDVANVNNSTHDKFYEETKETLKSHRGKAEYHRMLSTEAAKKYLTRSL